MASGVTVCQTVLESYNNLKLGKAKPAPAWLIAKLNDAKTQVVLDESLEAPSVAADFDEAVNRGHFNQVLQWITDEQPRYIVFDFRFMKEGGQKVGKLGFISWCSDNSPVKMRMLHSATNNTVKKAFDGAIDFQVSAKDEFDYDEFQKEIAKRA